MPLTRPQAARRIQRMYRRRGRGVYRKRYAIRRRVLVNPTPTFVETFSVAAVFANTGNVFAARISDIPQFTQYATLYKQYRINWVKVMILPDFNSTAADQNAAQYNATIPTGNVGMARIAWAINDSPALVAPANEAQLLEDNGCKIAPLATKWSCSFKPVPNVGVTSLATGNVIAAKQRYKTWFNFDTQTLANNPLHYGVSAYITQPVNGLNILFNVYYKVNFSLRDPQ